MYSLIFVSLIGGETAMGSGSLAGGGTTPRRLPARATTCAATPVQTSPSPSVTSVGSMQTPFCCLIFMLVPPCILGEPELFM
jgi:hypothetical protein